MKNKEKLARPESARRWTRIDDYLLVMSRLRMPRERPRTQPETPRFALSTLPFLALLALLAVLAVAIAAAAWPGGERPRPRAAPESAEPGTAPAGWMDKAEREFR